MKKLSFLVLMIVVLPVLVACGTATPTATQAVQQLSTPEPTQAPVETSATQTPVVDALFQVMKANGSKFDVTLDDIKKLQFANITVDGKVQEGPKLLDILTLAGVTDFTEVTLTGSASPVTLTRAQVDDNTILDLNNHGTLKLATTYIPMPD